MFAPTEQGDCEPVASQRIHCLEADIAAADDHCAARFLFGQITLQPDPVIERVEAENVRLVRPRDRAAIRTRSRCDDQPVVMNPLAIYQRYFPPGMRDLR